MVFVRTPCRCTEGLCNSLSKSCIPSFTDTVPFDRTQSELLSELFNETINEQKSKHLRGELKFVVRFHELQLCV
jgi:hypothetical protein